MQPLRLSGKAKDTFKMAQDGLQNASRAHGKRKRIKVEVSNEEIPA
jgi:hypothetical protein